MSEREWLTKAKKQYAWGETRIKQAESCSMNGNLDQGNFYLGLAQSHFLAANAAVNVAQWEEDE